MPLWHHWAFRYIQDGVQDGGQLLVKNLCFMEKCLKSTFSLKLLAMTLESIWRHSVHSKKIKKNTNLGKMASKMAIYYKKNIRKFSLRPANYRDLHVKMLILLILVLHHPCNIQMMQLMHYSDFDMFKMASRMVAEYFYKPMGAAPNLLTCLVDL